MPTAPLLKVTVLLAAVVSNPVPAMVRVVALIARLFVFKVTVGAATMFATCTAMPLVPPKDVTTAVRLPSDGAVLKVTINRVAVALVTVPVPLLKLTVLLAAVASNPVPAMVRVVALIARLFVFKVTVGVATMLATCTVVPLLIAFVVTIAVRLPRDGAVSNVTVNWVAAAFVTVPVPLLKVTTLLAAVVSKPVPLRIRVVAFIARLFVVFKVTVGAVP